MNSKEIAKKALKCIDLVGLSNVLIDDVIEKAINDAVLKSETKIDDAVVAILIPIIKVEAKKYVEKLIADLKLKLEA